MCMLSKSFGQSCLSLSTKLEKELRDNAKRGARLSQGNAALHSAFTATLKALSHAEKASGRPVRAGEAEEKKPA